MRLSFNDLHVFDTDLECWLKELDIEGAPKKRQNHVAATFGPVMIVHGGFNTEQKKVLNDFGLFDFELNKWVNCRVFQESQRIDDKHLNYDDQHHEEIGFRQMHTMTAVIDDEYY